MKFSFTKLSVNFQKNNSELLIIQMCLILSTIISIFKKANHRKKLYEYSQAVPTTLTCIIYTCNPWQ